MKKALITGIKGQDGSYLAKFLLEKGYKVYGADTNSNLQGSGVEKLGISNDIIMLTMNLLDVNSINKVIDEVMPDELYNLAAQSSISVSFERPILTADIDAMGVVRLLEAIKHFCPKCKFFQAVSSEIFGNTDVSPQSESTSLNPRNPYGVAKGYSYWIIKNFRESYDMHLSNGILYNHESQLRGSKFVTRKITESVAKISLGKQEKLILGNIDATRDWGYAPEYVEAMRLMLQEEKGDDYVIATGKLTSVRSFVESAFSYVGIELLREGEGIDEVAKNAKTGDVLVTISEDFYRPLDTSFKPLVGDASKAKSILGREPKIDISGIVKSMMEYDITIVSGQEDSQDNVGLLEKSKKTLINS